MTTVSFRRFPSRTFRLLLAAAAAATAVALSRWSSSSLSPLQLRPPPLCEGFSTASSLVSRQRRRSFFSVTSSSSTTTTALGAAAAGGNATAASEAAAATEHAIRIERNLPPRDDDGRRTRRRLSANEEALSERTFPRTWVPLASVWELDPDRPTPLSFLGQKYVCYREEEEQRTTSRGGDSKEGDDGRGGWVVLDDVCSHRLAPLSEGRVHHRRCDDGSGTTTTTTTTTLMCSYHGWEFGGDGRCARIPQATERIERAAIGSPRSAVASYSVRVHKNVLWFWPWPDVDALSLTGVYPKGHPEGIMGSIGNLPDGDDEDDDDDDDRENGEDDVERGETSFPMTYTRDLPYGWDTLMENLIDPAHIPFAHHNLQGKRDDAIPISMTVPESLGGFGSNEKEDAGGEEKEEESRRFGPAGFLFEWQDRTGGKHRAGTGEFQAPFGIAYEAACYVDKEDADASMGSHIAAKRSALGLIAADPPPPAVDPVVDDDDGREERPFKLGVLCIPTEPGWSRAIILTGGQTKGDGKTTKRKPKPDGATATKPAKKTKKKKKGSPVLFRILVGIIPPWVFHLFSNRFLDSDLAFLHYQERERLRYGGYGDADRRYHTPAESDRCVTALRRWIPRYTDYHTVEGARLPPTPEDPSLLFDRHRQHTAHCRHCRAGLAFLRGTVRRTATTGLVLFAAAALRLHRRRSRWGFAAELAVLSCAMILRWVAAIERAFAVGGFDHASNH